MSFGTAALWLSIGRRAYTNYEILRGHLELQRPGHGHWDFLVLAGVGTIVLAILGAALGLMIDDVTSPWTVREIYQHNIRLARTERNRTRWQRLRTTPSNPKGTS